MNSAIKTSAYMAQRGVRRKYITEALWGYFFLFPQLIGLIIFALIPLISVFGLSMLSWDGLGPITFVGLQNFSEQLSAGGDLALALTNTLYYTAITVPTSIILALLVALGLNKVRGKDIYRMLYFMPYVTSSVVVAVIWMWLMNSDFGLINAGLRAFFNIEGPRWLIDSNFVIPSISIVTIWSGLGFNMILFLAGLQSISQAYIEAAYVDGASRRQIFWRITLPLLSPTIFLVMVLSIISSFQVFDQIYVLTGGGPAKASYMIVFHIYDLAFQQFQFGPASAAAVILFAIILLVTLAQFWLQRRWVHYEA